MSGKFYLAKLACTRMRGQAEANCISRIHTRAEGLAQIILSDALDPPWAGDLGRAARRPRCGQIVSIRDHRMIWEQLQGRATEQDSRGDPRERRKQTKRKEMVAVSGLSGSPGSAYRTSDHNEGLGIAPHSSLIRERPPGNERC